MTDTKDWKPSEEMQLAFDMATGYSLFPTIRDGAIKRLRPLIIAEEQERLRQKRNALPGHRLTEADYACIVESARALKDSKL